MFTPLDLPFPYTVMHCAVYKTRAYGNNVEHEARRRRITCDEAHAHDVVTLISRDGGPATRLVAGDVDGGRATMCLDAQLVASCRRLVRRDLRRLLACYFLQLHYPTHCCCCCSAAAAATAADNAELVLTKTLMSRRRVINGASCVVLINGETPAILL